MRNNDNHWASFISKDVETSELKETNVKTEDRITYSLSTEASRNLESAAAR